VSRLNFLEVSCLALQNFTAYYCPNRKLKNPSLYHKKLLQEFYSLWFINWRPNLLNVAVSRARKLFILVGNLVRIYEGGHTRELVEYIKEFGEMR
jgi:hypothetical protein